MTNRSTFIVGLLVSTAAPAFADAPGEVEPTPNTSTRINHRLGKAEPESYGPWGGGLRLTGLSGIGALPGVNVGGEVAVFVRHDEYFGELALGRWRPEETMVVAETPQRIELGLDVWSARGGWASNEMPLRAWALAEVGEVAGPPGMSSAVARMMMMSVPSERRWIAAGGGFGVAWPMSDYARLLGSVEFAVPLDRKSMMLSEGKPYQPDVAAARCSLGLEVGWH